MQEKRWYEDMFTPEGIPIKAPTNAGMKGAQNWRYDREQSRYIYEKEESRTAAASYR